MKHSSTTQNDENLLRRQLTLMTLLGIGTLLVLLLLVLSFGSASRSPSLTSEDTLAVACHRPDWLDNDGATDFDFEPISPTPLPANETDDAQLSHVAQYTRTEPYIEYDIDSAPLAEPYSLRWRMGIGIPENNPLYFQWPAVRPGWYLNWTTGYAERERFGGLLQTGQTTVPDDVQAGMTFAPMVRVPQGELRPSAEVLIALARQYPGRTWLIGNEPDVEWQDDATPEQYAFAYRCAEAAIRGGDPTAKIAFAGLSQITPLRLQYLDRIWDYYQTVFGKEMNVDVWNMHAFVLREERDSWGVHIPPGLDDINAGELWEIDDHDNIELVRGQVELMREWMYEHGQHEKPLIISEYGILLPNSYGFPLHEVVNFMWQTSDLFQALRDPRTGYPEDDFRLVQRWVWFSTRYDLYPTGNLFNLDDTPGPLMRAMSAYIEQNSTQ